MNILYICDEYPPCQIGGIGAVTRALARSVAEKGHKVVVAGFYPYYRKAAEHEFDQVIEVYRFFYGNKWKLRLSKHRITGRFINIRKEFDRYLVKLNSLIDKYRVDIIEMPDFSETIYYGRFTSIDFAKLKRPVIIKMHGTYSFFSVVLNDKIINKNIYNLEKKIFKKADGIIALSEISKKINQVIFSLNAPVIIIPNGIIIRNNLEYTGDLSNIVVFAGTLAEKKGVFNLASAWKIVHKILPEALLYLYGKGSEYFKMKIRNEIPDNLFLFGAIPQEQLLKVYSHAACAVFPSFVESFAMAPLEAMSVGCPTIYTKLSSGPELITDGVDGLLVDPKDINEIADAIILMLTDRQKAKDMGNKGYQKVRDKFEISLIADRQIAYYESLLTENHKEV
jgi:glycogen synthase